MGIRFYRSIRRIRRFFGHISTTRSIVMVFLGIIVLGSVLLMLPVSSASGLPTDFRTALFTATSATCVTGLSLVDTFTHWSGFGQAVILLLIQIGGLGFMTIVSMLFFAVNRRFGLKAKLLVAQSYGLEQLGGILGLVRRVLLGTLLIEGTGAALLTVRFCLQTDFFTALWQGVFHSVSAFCNAGFDIFGAVEAGGSLVLYAEDPAVNVILMALIMLGGLGFFVWDDLLRSKRFRRLTVYSKLVLVISAVLTVGGAVLFALMEWNNPQTLGNLSTGGKVLAVCFQSVTTRTAGFYTIPQGMLTGAGKALTDVLMFIGGSSGSTAGGAKTVTIGVLLLSVAAAARGKSRVTVFRRTIASKQISDAVAVVGMMFLAALSCGMVLSLTNALPFEDCMYESISAIATVGLSTGITASLNALSQMLLVVLMFFGRVGIMTVSLGLLMSDQAQEQYRYADTNVLIG